ncbi:small secreted protein [Streptomyces sp. NPDC059248]|uniref:small secreted protein n=1 Tax=Streptomyces sp. NPDC059248 TaxID=3346791 RepID=UPI00368C927D
MNKKLAAVLSGGAVLVLALSGCSSDEKKDNAVNDWAEKYCDQIKTQFKTKAEADQLIAVTAVDGKPAELQKADSKAFQDLSNVNKALAAAFRTVGPTPVEEDVELVTAAAAERDASAAFFLDLKKQVDALDASDQQDFADGLQVVSEGLLKAEANEKAWNKLRASETGRAMGTFQGCQPVKADPPAAAGPSASPSS